MGSGGRRVMADAFGWNWKKFSLVAGLERAEK
jgi:hypothetical protein